MGLDPRTVHCGAGNECPRPACAVSIPAEKFCCDYCYKLIPVSIRLVLESSEVQASSECYVNARLAAVNALRATRITTTKKTSAKFSLAIRIGIRRRRASA